MASLPITLRRLGRGDVASLRALNALFGDRETYGAEPPTDAYLDCLLGKEHVVVLVAPAGDEVLGGLVAYEPTSSRGCGASCTSTISPSPRGTGGGASRPP